MLPIPGRATLSTECVFSPVVVLPVRAQRTNPLPSPQQESSTNRKPTLVTALCSFSTPLAAKPLKSRRLTYCPCLSTRLLLLASVVLRNLNGAPSEMFLRGAVPDHGRVPRPQAYGCFTLSQTQTFLCISCVAPFRPKPSRLHSGLDPSSILVSLADRQSLKLPKCKSKSLF